MKKSGDNSQSAPRFSCPEFQDNWVRVDHQRSNSGEFATIKRLEKGEGKHRKNLEAGT